MKTIKNYITYKPPILYILLIGLLFPLVFYKLFNAGFVSWDDADYVLENKDVHAFNISNLLTRFYVGNYHPLTMLSYAIDWKLFGKEPLGYHLVNLSWHFINTALVFFLSKHFLKQDTKAFLVALIFAFHPLQLESIGWIAERKNMLYAFFFLSGMILYIRFLTTQNIKFLIGTFILFCLSLLSKPSAIVFPLVLFLADVLFNVKINQRQVIQKIPFLLISVLFAVITIKAQVSFINEQHNFGFHERIGYAGYAILQYFYHFFVPIKLAVIYPYPENKSASIIVGYFVIAAIGFACYKLVKGKHISVLIGLLFFIGNLLLVLQFIPFGEVLTADRYMYLPIIGLCWALLSISVFKEKQLRIISLIILITLSSLSFFRASVWQNSIALYSDILKKYPHSSLALSSLGAEYMLNKNFEQALTYLNTAINENRNSYKAYYNRGLLYAQTNQFNEALADFNKAITLNNYTKAFVARANVYYVMKDYTKAISDAETVLKSDKSNVKANYVLANCYDDLNQLDKALQYYNLVIFATNENPLFLMRRGILFGKMKQYEACLNDLNACTTLAPDFAEAYYWKGVVKVNLNQNPCEDLRKAIRLGFTVAQQSLIKYCN